MEWAKPSAEGAKTTKAEFVAELAKEGKCNPPPQRPLVGGELLVFYVAFLNLCRSRASNGFGPQPIQPHDVVAESTITGIPADRLAAYVRHLDGVWLDWWFSERERKQ